MGTRERAEIRQAKARSLRVFIYQRRWIIFQSSGSQHVEIFPVKRLLVTSGDDVHGHHLESGAIVSFNG